MQNKEVKPLPLLPLVLTLFGLILVFHLANALAGKPFIRAVHLGAALHYAQSNIDLLRPVIRGCNATGTPATLEFPLWQAAVALVFKAAGTAWYGWANVVSWLLFGSLLWPLFQLSRQYVGDRAAWWGLAFLLAQPIIVVNAGQASPDGLSLAVTIWFLYFANKLVLTGALGWWVPTVVFACLGAVLKPPFFMAAGFCSVFLLLLNGIRTWRPWLLLASAGAVATGVFYLWISYTNSLWAQAVYPCMDMRLAQNPDLVTWYFGGLRFRLNPGPWAKGAWRFLHATLGSLPLAVLLVISLMRPGNWLPKLWLLATLLTTLVFTSLVLGHWHYYLMCAPAVALLCGAALARWEDFAARELPQPVLRLTLAGMVLILSAMEGILAMKININYDSFRKEMGVLIRQYTRPEDKIIVYGGDWGAEELLRSDRQGLSVFHLETSPGAPASKGLRDLLGTETSLRQLKALGYNKLVLLSESPAWFAAKAVNPGSKVKRGLYPASISASVDAWPELYRSEDILIKEIP